MGTPEKPIRILWLEDSENDLFVLERHIRNDGLAIEVSHVETGEQCLAGLNEGGWDLLIVDCGIPGMEIWDAYVKLREIDEETPFLVLSGQIPEEILAHLETAEGAAIVLKSTPEKVAPTIRELVSASRS